MHSVLVAKAIPAGRARRRAHSSAATAAQRQGAAVAAASASRTKDAKSHKGRRLTRGPFPAQLVAPLQQHAAAPLGYLIPRRGAASGGRTTTAPLEAGASRGPGGHAAAAGMPTRRRRRKAPPPHAAAAAASVCRYRAAHAPQPAWSCCGAGVTAPRRLALLHQQRRSMRGRRLSPAGLAAARA